MSYTYTPREDFRLRPGKHRVRVVEAIETYSKAGNPMIELHLKVHGFEDMKPMKAFMVLSDSTAWRVRQMRLALGYTDPIDQKTIIDAKDMVHKTAWVLIEKPEGSKYLEITEWHDDYMATQAPKGASRATAPSIESDEIPF